MAPTNVRGAIIPINQLIARLPAFSPIALRLMAIITHEDVSFKEVAKLIQLDPALSGEVLKLANSGLYGRGFVIRSVLHAIGLVGIKRVTTIVITAALWKGLPRRAAPPIKDWWRHSIASALVGAHVASDRMETEYAYTASLLHAIGQLALFQYAFKTYEDLLIEVRASGDDLLQRERSVFGADHTELADSILGYWKLPLNIRDAVAKHHATEPPNSHLAHSVNAGCFAAEWAGFGTCGWHNCVSAADVPAHLKSLIDSNYIREGLAHEVNGIECSLV
jgi:HD-like signal output (HDOD) protein